MTSGHIFILGDKVTIAEQENVGGTCLNHGCIPSKLMKTTAQLLDRFRHADSFGVAIDGSVKLDLTKWKSRKKTLIDTQIKGIETLLQQILGVHIVGPSATELIAEGTLAVQHGISVAELADTFHVHPPLSKVVMETASKAADKPVHG